MSSSSSVRDVEDAGLEFDALVGGGAGEPPLQRVVARPLMRAGGARRLLRLAPPRPVVAAAAAVALLVCIGGAAFWRPADGRGIDAGAAAAPPALVGTRTEDGAGLQIAADSNPVQLTDDASEQGDDSKPRSDNAQQENDAKQQQQQGEKDKKAAGRAPAKKGCYTIADHEECCKHYDARPWDYHGSECVPSKLGDAFHNGRTCQPKCWVDGLCDWKHPRDKVHGKNYTAFAGSCPTASTTVMPTSTSTLTTSSTVSSTVTSTSTSTTEIPECWAEAVTFEPLNNNLTKPATQAASVLECQALCQKQKSCFHFSFWKPAGHCYFQDIWARPQPSRVGFVSGPKRCGQALDMTKWANIGNETWVPAKFDCIQVGFVFTSNILKADVKIDEKLPGPKATLACQAACAAHAECANFTMQFPGRTCQLVATGAMASPTASETVVGAPTCG